MNILTIPKEILDLSVKHAERRSNEDSNFVQQLYISSGGGNCNVFNSRKSIFGLLHVAVQWHLTLKDVLHGTVIRILPLIYVCSYSLPKMETSICSSVRR